MNAHRVLATLAGIACLIAGSLAASPAATAASADVPAQGYYVSLGDSLAFGYQPNLVAAGDLNAADYVGYAEDFATMRPGLTLVNYGCPGETTTTMISGGCPWPGTLHASYNGAPSQFAAAESFLLAHPGAVSLISIDIGSNDLLGLLDSCKGAADPNACVLAGLPATLATLGAHYELMVGTLHALAPNARIVLFNFYNPLAFSAPGSDQLSAIASSVVDQVAAHFSAPVADAFGAINHVAGSPSEQAFICVRTWECTSFQNIHPTDVGYQALAVALLHAIS